MQSYVRTALGKPLTDSLRQVLQSTLGYLARNLGRLAGRSVGGGLFGGVLSSLLGGGLSALFGGLFRRKRTVKVENIVQTEVLNFPSLSELSYAVNPASRLFGGRAVGRGPALTVELSYRDGVEDLVAAKVTQRLRELNNIEGVG